MMSSCHLKAGLIWLTRFCEIQEDIALTALTPMNGVYNVGEFKNELLDSSGWKISKNFNFGDCEKQTSLEYLLQDKAKLFDRE